MPAGSSTVWVACLCTPRTSHIQCTCVRIQYQRPRIYNTVFCSGLFRPYFIENKTLLPGLEFYVLFKLKLILKAARVELLVTYDIATPDLNVVLRDFSLTYP